MNHKETSVITKTLGMLLAALGMYVGLMANPITAYATEWDEQESFTKIGPGAGLYHDAMKGPICWQQRVDGEDEDLASTFQLHVKPLAKDSFLLSGVMVFFRGTEKQTIFPVYGNLTFWEGQAAEDVVNSSVLLSLTMNFPPDEGVSGTTQTIVRGLNPDTLSGRYHAIVSGVSESEGEQTPFSSAFNGNLKYLGLCEEQL